MDEFLKFASGFDWITPSAAFLEDLLNDGPVSHFGIRSDSGLGPGDIETILSERGVNVWGFMLDRSGETLMFTVPEAQAKWAYYLLVQSGAPLLYVPAAALPSPGKGSGNRKDPDLFDSISNFFDRLDSGFW
jgi:hypothetical protein